MFRAPRAAALAARRINPHSATPLAPTPSCSSSCLLAPQAAALLTSRTFASSAMPRREEQKAKEVLPAPPAKPKHASTMTPPELVGQLDRFIIGQADAKRAMASAIRYRWRRKQLEEGQRDDCTPKNILMIGPTGCGKTEIARRLAKIIDAPFVIAEATKFTEVGFHGRDIESVMKDLMEASLKMTRKKMEAEIKPVVTKIVDDKILSALLGDMEDDTDKKTWLRHLHKGLIEDRTIEIELPAAQQGGGGPDFGRPGAAGGDMDFGQERDIGNGMKLVSGGRHGGKVEKRKMYVKDARVKLMQAELDARISQEDLVQRSLKAVEDDGIIFLDEIDKIVSAKGSYGPDASSEGVQRDLLPIIEGTSVPTKYGQVRSDHVLFVCAGSFHAVKPEDMLAELRGRLPITMRLHPLTEGDFFRILSEPEFGLIKQNSALLATEGVEVVWTDCGLREIARFAAEMNKYTENIGARRLNTVIERITDELSFNACSYAGERVDIDEAFVTEKLKAVEINRAQKGLL